TRTIFTGLWLLPLGGLLSSCTINATIDPAALQLAVGGAGGTAGQQNGGAGSAGLPGDAGSTGLPGEGDAGISGGGGTSGSGPLPDGGSPDPDACSVEFVTPSPADVPLTLGPADDGDGVACGSSFTTDVVVASNGVTVTLFVDGAPWAAELVTEESSIFDGVLLGSRTPATSTLRAVATMADGRSCEATLGSLGVDCAGPTCTLTGPSNPSLDDADDADVGTPGLQTSFALQTDPDNTGTEAHLILDGDLGAALSASFVSTSLTFADVTLAEGPARTVQGECRDQFGNITRSVLATWSVELRDAPSVEIASPAAGTVLNLLGTSGATADLNPGSASCEADVVVRCSDLEASVVLLVDGSPLFEEAPCLEDLAAVAPYHGTATFSAVSLSALADSHTLAAQQTFGSLEGNSATVTIETDCVAPVLAITDPLCGGQLHLVTDDSQSGQLGLQHDVDVSNGGAAEVSLTVSRGGSSQQLLATGSGPTTSFADVTFGAVGDVTLSATASDAAGNMGSASCAVTVVVEPPVNILLPTADQVLSTLNDCVPAGGGFGITVSGTTGAGPGSSVAVAIDGGSSVALAPVAAGGGGLNTFSGCVAIGDGADQTISVTVTGAPNPPGNDTVAVSVDTLAPTDPVPAPLVVVTNRRAGEVTFTWNQVADADGSLLAGYDLRCASAQINDETAWNAARQLTVSTAGAGPGSPQATELIPSPTCSGDFCRSFRVGTTESCVMRGRDIAGALTPLSGAAGNVAVSVPFVNTPFTGVVNGNSSFTNVIPLGDVNGDGASDMAYGVTAQGMQVFFGGTSGSPFNTTADVALTNGGVSAFGAVLASVGDVNGDGRPDFAASARALTGNAGTVYLFFGRPAGTPWPSSITVNAGGCGADVCLVGSAAGAFFGWDITGTDFNGDGTSDLVISARAASTGVGAVYVILGGTQLQVAAGTSINVPSGNPNGFVITPPASRTLFGHAVAAVGSGTDARGDLAISALGASGGNPGALFFLNGEAYPGGSSGLIAPSASPMLEVTLGSGADFGSPVRAVGDFDGDALGDLALGRNFSAGGGLGSGELYLRNANVPTFTSGPGFRFDFAATGVDNDYGSSIATGLNPSLGAVGDLDGDGLTELAIGSLAGGTGGSLALFYGAETVVARVRSNADFTLTASATSLLIPNFVGDFDGDGFNDLAVVDGGAGADRVILLH
ncbi:MAG: hypothetical protein RL033_3664, partial [Pseudomonadota bacterium]